MIVEPYLCAHPSIPGVSVLSVAGVCKWCVREIVLLLPQIWHQFNVLVYVGELAQVWSMGVVG